MRALCPRRANATYSILLPVPWDGSRVEQEVPDAPDSLFRRSVSSPSTAGIYSYDNLSDLFLSDHDRTVTSPDSETLPEVVQVGTELAPQVLDPAVDSIEDILGRHSRVDSVERSRIANAVVTSARRHDVDPFLVTSILLVESSANPFAISGRDAVGIMQIHLPTWGSLAETEQINLFRIEDNIDLGARILREYTRQHGLWDGVLRYLGTNGPTEEGAAYLRRVQGIYSDRLAD